MKRIAVRWKVQDDHHKGCWCCIRHLTRTEAVRHVFAWHGPTTIEKNRRLRGRRGRYHPVERQNLPTGWNDLPYV